MIIASLTLMRRLIREAERQCGSLARIHFYDGVMPDSTETQAEGETVLACEVPDNFIADVLYGEEPQLVLGANYWRLLSNEGRVVLQGDGRP